jgi:hypothetical protein
MARPTQLMNESNILAAALDGLVAQRDKLDEQIRQIRGLLGKKSPGRPAKSAAGTAAMSDDKPKRRRKMSAAARKRIAEAQKKRWSEYRKQQKAEA